MINYLIHGRDVCIIRGPAGHGGIISYHLEMCSLLVDYTSAMGHACGDVVYSAGVFRFQKIDTPVGGLYACIFFFFFIGGLAVRRIRMIYVPTTVMLYIMIHRPPFPGPAMIVLMESEIVGSVHVSLSPWIS